MTAGLDVASQVVAIGTTFRAAHADANVLWECKAPSGKNAWICVSVDEKIVIGDKEYPSDYAGIEKAFSVADIKGRLAYEKMWQAEFQRNDDFYNSLEFGAIVHYDNGFANFVRCKVAIGEVEFANRGIEKVLFPIALVGKWHKNDLPHRMANGEIDYSHCAKSVIERRAMRPNFTCIWESSAFGGRSRSTDPRGMKPISLEVPPMTPEQEHEARLWQELAKIRKLAGGDGNPTQLLTIIKGIVDKSLPKSLPKS